MSDEEFAALAERVTAFHLMELPGQPRAMHMGTSYLIGDLFKAVKDLRTRAEKAEAALAARDRRIARLVAALNDARAKGYITAAEAGPAVVASAAEAAEARVAALEDALREARALIVQLEQALADEGLIVNIPDPVPPALARIDALLEDRT